MLLQTKIIISTTQQCRPFHEEEDTASQRLDQCAPIFLYGITGYRRGGNGLSKLFRFRGQTIDLSDQAVLTLK